MLQNSNLRLIGIFRLQPLLMIRVALILVMAWWAFILFWPVETFPTGLGYRYFARIAPEGDWATFFLAVTLLGVVSLKWPRIRPASAHVLSFAHGMVSILFLLGNSAGTASGVYAVFALLAAYLVMVDRNG